MLWTVISISYCSSTDDWVATIDELRDEKSHVGQEVEDEGGVKDTERLVNESSNVKSAWFVIALWELMSSVLDLKSIRFLLELVIWGEGIRVHIIDPADGSESNKSDDDFDWIAERAQENDAWNFSKDTA